MLDDVDCIFVFSSVCPIYKYRTLCSLNDNPRSSKIGEGHYIDPPQPCADPSARIRMPQ